MSDTRTPSRLIVTDQKRSRKFEFSVAVWTWQRENKYGRFIS